MYEKKSFRGFPSVSVYIYNIILVFFGEEYY